MLSTGRKRARLLPTAVIDRIHALLRASGRIPADLAREIGLSQAGVGRILNRQRGTSPETIEKIAAALRTTRADLFADAAADAGLDPSLAGYGSLDAAPVADWLTDPDLRVMFYGITHDLTPAEIESIKPILWKEYLAILARRGERDARRGPAGSGAPS